MDTVKYSQHINKYVTEDAYPFPQLDESATILTFVSLLLMYSQALYPSITGILRSKTIILI